MFLQQNECVSRAARVLKATPALHDNEMENNISLRIRQLYGMHTVQSDTFSWLLSLRCVRVCLPLLEVPVHLLNEGFVQFTQKNLQNVMSFPLSLSFSWMAGSYSAFHFVIMDIVY